MLEILKNSLIDSLYKLLDMVSGALPGIIAAIVVFIVFWLIAKLVRLVVRKVLKKIKVDDLTEKLEIDGLLASVGIKKLSNFSGGLLYWLIILFGLIVSSEIIGIPAITNGVASIMGYLPKLAAAFIIFLIGLFLSEMIKKMVLSATSSIGLSGGKVIANIVYYIILIFISITALNQTGIDTSIITSNLTLIFGSMLVAFAISYGFASRDILTNVLSSFYGKDRFKVGMKIKIKDSVGEIVKIDSLAITLKTESNIKIIPVKTLITEEVEILDGI